MEKEGEAVKYYVVADVHGHFSVLKKELEKAGFFADKEPNKLIVCGDLLDRGTEAVKLIDFMMELLREDRLIFILGNHEDNFYSCMQEIASGNIRRIAEGGSVHYINGTWESILQIAETNESEMAKELSRKPGETFEEEKERQKQVSKDLLKKVMASPFYKVLLTKGIDFYETENYIFVHGWIPCNMDNVGSVNESFEYIPNWRECEVWDWKRARWCNGMKLACDFSVKEPNKTIVCGHWHAAYGHAVYEKKGKERGEGSIHTPFYADGIIAIDARTAESGEINCIVIED